MLIATDPCLRVPCLFSTHLYSIGRGKHVRLDEESKRHHPGHKLQAGNVLLHAPNALHRVLREARNLPRDKQTMPQSQQTCGNVPLSSFSSYIEVILYQSCKAVPTYAGRCATPYPHLRPMIQKGYLDLAWNTSGPRGPQ